MSTGLGVILYFDSATLALVGSINFSATQIRLSTDGTLLAARARSTGGTVEPVNIYSLPATSPTGGSIVGSYIALSGSGTVLAWNSANAQEAGSPTGGSLIFSTPAATGTSGALSLSPDGSLIVTAAYQEPPDVPSTNIGSSLWHNGLLVTALSGLPGGWLDNSRLVMNNYVYPGDSFVAQYSSCTLYDPTGTQTGAPCALKQEVRELQPVSSDLVYAPLLNQILTVSTGVVDWSTADPFVTNLGFGIRPTRLQAQTSYSCRDRSYSHNLIERDRPAIIPRTPSSATTIPAVAEITVGHGGASGVAFAWEQQLLSSVWK